MVLEIPVRIRKVLAVSFLLIFISTFAVIVFGTSAAAINIDIQEVKSFLVAEKDTQKNFQESLQLYTENTGDVIKYLLQLRPQNEAAFIDSISKIENIGQKINLTVGLQVLDNAPVKNVTDAKLKTLDFNVSFFGTVEDLKKFLKELEILPYFIRVSEISFKNPELITTNDKKQPQNVNLKINLYIK